MVRRNPFRYGKPVTGKDFVNRKKEVKELLRDLQSDQNVILYSPRRYGKTSLIKEAFRQFPAKTATVYIDLYGILTKEELAQRTVNALAIGAYPSLGRLRSALKNLFSSVIPQIIIESGGMKVRLAWDRSREDANLEEIFDLPQKIAERGKRKLVVAFDEFQDLRELDGVRIEKLMRSKFQHHKNVTYLFAGSKPSMMLDMFENPNCAFYKFGKLSPLPKMSDDALARFIKNTFTKNKKKIDGKTIEKIVKFVDGNPYFAQIFCSEIWNLGGSNISTDHYHQAITALLRKSEDSYIQMFDSLTKTQKKLLVGICKNPELSLYSKEFTQKHGLRPANIQRALPTLRKKRLIENAKISDVFFEEWIKRKKKG